MSTLPGLPKPDATEKTPAERTAELLHRMVCEHLCDKGLPPAKEIRRSLKNLAQRIDATYDEVAVIFEDILPYYIGSGLGWEGVGITYEGQRTKE